MSEMSERVTKAIRDELINIGYGVGTINAGQLSDALFRVAIEAMREPTQEMVWAANRNNHPRDEETWRTMIDAIFAKTPA